MLILMVEVWLWSQKQDIGPLPRGYHAMSYDSHQQQTLLFGGVSFNNEYLSDTWEWDGDAWTQVADTGPSLRAFTSMTFDSKRNRTVLFGGADTSGNILNDTWEWMELIGHKFLIMVLFVVLIVSYLILREIRRCHLEEWIIIIKIYSMIRGMGRQILDAASRYWTTKSIAFDGI